MSQIGSASPGGIGVSITASAQVAEAAAAIGLVPGIGPAVLAERFRDAGDFHRRSILRNHKLPGGARATRFLASRLYHYGRKRSPVRTMADAQGESFAADVAGFRGQLARLERGGAQNTAAPMAIPIMGFPDRVRGTKTLGPQIKRQFRDALARGDYDVTPTGLLVREVEGGRGKGRRTLIAGVLVRRIDIRPQLGFFARWTEVEPRVAAKLERDAALILTEAGRAAIAERERAGAASRVAAKAARVEALLRSPGDYAGARKAAAAAAAKVRADRLAGGGAAPGGTAPGGGA